MRSRSAAGRRFAPVVLLLLASGAAAAQQDSAAAPHPGRPPYTQEELDQMLAPIALHPDSLLSQMFMAATYPIEVVQADRFAKQHADLEGDALATALESQTWDPSVRSLVNFPSLLAMMSEQLEWTMDVGNAFLGQPKEVLATVQKLRAKAQEEGHLESTPEQTVSRTDQDGTEVIVIESSDPDVVYVPVYDTTVIYGAWWYPAYPPRCWYPPACPAPAVRGFIAGATLGAAWGYAWGRCDWGHGDIDVDVNRNVDCNRTIDRARYATTSASVRGGAATPWRHDPSHRHGVAYRDPATAQRRFTTPRTGAPSATRTAAATTPRTATTAAADAPWTRDAYRGREPAGSAPRTNGFSDIERGGRSATEARSRGESSRYGSSSSGRARSAGRGRRG